MQTIQTVTALRGTLGSLREAGDRIAFVPTMGNLHDGHLELVRQATRLAEHVIVSIFVNPLQFNDKKDLDAYPLTLDEDILKLAENDVNILFHPDLEEIYPGAMDQSTRVEVPGLSDMLCGHYRPGHFVGVTTVVARLFNIVQPDVAVFGEKDYQQLVIIRRMVAALCFPVEIAGVATVREADGLAMSSRNSYLSKEDRESAPDMYRILQDARERILKGETDYRKIETHAMAELDNAGFTSEYVAIRRAEDLEDKITGDENLVILAAAWLGKARLIDNILIKRT
jgi:pantoate--beta-alanine ligase